MRRRGALAVCLATALASVATAFSPRYSLRMAATSVVNGVSVPGKLVPDQNFILVKLRKGADASEGGVFLPNQAKEKPRDGEVIAVGPGKVDPETGVLLATEVEAGDKIVYGEYDGTRVVINGVDYQVLEDRNVLLIYNGEKPTMAGARLLEDRVAIKLNAAVQETTRGVLIAESAKKGYVAQDGEVMAVGPGLRTSMGERIPMQVSVGEFARFKDYVGADIDLDGQDYRVVRMSDIVAKWQ